MNSVMQRFTYQPLKTDRSFRLATLHGAQQTDQIKITVQEYEFDTCPAYIALSYEWGDEQEKYILLNGTTFRIRRNLYDFLKTIRSGSSKTRILFIDALCINQMDRAERSFQVHLMRNVYEGAARVWAWLGRDSVASDMVADICQGQRVDTAHTDLQTTLTLEHGAREVLQRRYWTRMWMMSELMIAKAITLFCGQRSFSWNQLVTVLSSQVPEWYHNSSATREFRAVEDIRAKVREGTRVPILKLFEEFGQMECELKQDRVYSLLAFHAHAKKLSCVSTDYERSSEKVFVEALRYCTQAPEKVTDQEESFEIVKCSRAFQASLGLDPQKNISAILQVMREHPSNESLRSAVFKAPLEEAQILGKVPQFNTGASFQTESALAGFTVKRITVHAHRYTKTEIVLTNRVAHDGDQVFRIRGSAIAVIWGCGRKGWRVMSLGIVVPKDAQIRRTHANFLYHGFDGAVEDAAGTASLSLSCFDVAVLSSLPEATHQSRCSAFRSLGVQALDRSGVSWQVARPRKSEASAFTALHIQRMSAIDR